MIAGPTRQDRQWPRFCGRLRAAMVIAILSILPADAADTCQHLKVLIVVAHPDDEYAFAATTYRLAHELGATVDQVVISNGESGYRYSGLAELVYGVHLTDQASARARLPEIRRQEALAAGRILGIRHHHFLGQRDGGITDNVDDTLGRVWNRTAVLQFLGRIMRSEHYDLVFTTLPTSETHAHHRAAALLTLWAASKLAEDARPVILAADPDDQDPTMFTGLHDFPITRPIDASPVVVFDRGRRFGFQSALNYHIVVNWVIAEYKSQGLFQHDYNKRDLERFWAFASGGPRVTQRCAALESSLNDTPSLFAIK